VQALKTGEKESFGGEGDEGGGRWRNEVPLRKQREEDYEQMKKEGG